ncbi:hypothetical protein [Flavobacterium sp.]|uniref:hypothetical protein n=1 Tax=Flavobacterium sp. TaxID=239 RepID=UPI002632E040|nr:hypothetical protein [Flavobacterium sp.]
MIWQKIDFNVLNEIYLPGFFRNNDILDLLNSASKPIVELHDESLYKMQHTSQVIYLEKMLNEFFEIQTYDSNSHIATRQVYIVDSPQPAKNYIYQSEENQPLYLGTIYLDRDNETNADFIIKIPESLEFDEPRLRAKVDYYKLAGKKYIIETY